MVSGDQSSISPSNATKADSSGAMTPRERLQGWQAAAVVMLVVGLGFVVIRAQWAAGFNFVAVVFLVGGWIVVWTLAALGAGRPIARWVGAGDELFQDDPLIAVIAGAGVLVACAAVLSLFGLFRPIPLMTVLVGWAAFGSFGLKRSPVDMPRPGVAWVPLLGLAGVSLLVVATVSPFYDQWHQHLGFPWIWLADGSVHPIPRNWYSYMPSGHCSRDCSPRRSRRKTVGGVLRRYRPRDDTDLSSSHDGGGIRPGGLGLCRRLVARPRSDGR